jgi:AraC-like DNA-binding protein/mannose-6-phosphate isomerase-like protein (cupin superfamily)
MSGQSKQAVPLHRPNTSEREHYIPKKTTEVSLHPKLLYSGVLKRSPNWMEEQHNHNFLEVIFVSKGSGTSKISGKDYSIKKGDILVYNAKEMHAETSSENDPLENYFFGVDQIALPGLPKGCLAPRQKSPVIHGEENEGRFAFLFSSLVRESQSGAHLSKEITESLSRTILLLILRILSEGAEQDLKVNRLYIRAKSYIDEYYAELGGIHDACNKLHMSNSYLTHLFRAHASTTPLRYLTGKKIELAKALLSTSTLSVHAISCRCGWDDPAYFCKVFKSYEKKTPGEYRGGE